VDRGKAFAGDKPIKKLAKELRGKHRDGLDQKGTKATYPDRSGGAPQQETQARIPSHTVNGAKKNSYGRQDQRIPRTY